MGITLLSLRRLLGLSSKYVVCVSGRNLAAVGVFHVRFCHCPMLISVLFCFLQGARSCGLGLESQ